MDFFRWILKKVCKMKVHKKRRYLFELINECKGREIAIKKIMYRKILDDM